MQMARKIPEMTKRKTFKGFETLQNLELLKKKNDVRVQATTISKAQSLVIRREIT